MSLRIRREGPPAGRRATAAAFDSYLDLAQLTISNGEVTAVQQLAFDDDTNGDDPVITIDLQPDEDYAGAVSGFNDVMWRPDPTRLR